MYDTVLIPTDGSEHAVRAAEHGLHVARQFDATVHVVNVIDVQSEGGLFSAGGVDEEFIDRLEAKGMKKIRDIDGLPLDDDRVHAEVIRGKPSKAILDYAGEHDADLLFMGTHGRAGLDRYVTGSVTERVVRLSDAPVFTVRATDRAVADDYDRILIPTDGSDCALRAADHGIAFAEAYDATVHTLNVVDIRSVAASSDITPPTAMVKRLQERGREATDEIAARAREAGLDAVTAVREDAPANGVLEYADEQDVDLTTMGTHGRSGLDRLLLGSTTAKVIRKSPAPVLSVRERDGE